MVKSLRKVPRSRFPKTGCGAAGAAGGGATGGTGEGAGASLPEDEEDPLLGVKTVARALVDGVEKFNLV